MAENGPPEMNWMLRIQDPVIERGFWRSPEYARLVHACYNLSSHFIPLVGCIVFCRQWKSPQTWQMICYEIIMAWGVVSGVWWRWRCSKLPADQRLKWKENLLIMYRVTTFLDSPFLILLAREMASRGAIQELMFFSLYKEDDHNTGLSALQKTIISTGTTFMILSGVAIPWHFRPQLVLQLYLLGLVIFLYQPAGMYLFQNTGPTDNIRHLCETLNNVSYGIQGMVVEPLSSSHYLPDVCSQDYIHVVALFVQVYSTYVCLHIAFRIEWYAKVQYIKRLFGEHLCMEWPLLIDCLFAACVWVGTWMLVCMFHKQLWNLHVPVASG